MPGRLAELFPDVPSDDLEQLRAYTSGALDEQWGLGERPAVLVIDMTRSFISDPTSAAYVPNGEMCANSIARLLRHTRERGLPTFYTHGMPFRHEAEAGAWLRGRGLGILETANRPEDHEIVRTVAPLEDDIVIAKGKPSGFFGTQLHSVLNFSHIDSLIVTGVTTSGCVRATVNDAFALNYPIVIPLECVADRAKVSHDIELFDMAVKYADVVKTGELIASF